MKLCMAYRETVIAERAVLVPCGMKSGSCGKSRFCRTHERAFREILTGILMEKKKKS